MKRSPIILAVFSLAAVALLLLGLYVGQSVPRYSAEIRGRFDGKRWSLPAIVYARPLELYPGLGLSPAMLEEELLLAGYRQEQGESSAGSYIRNGATIRLVTREFHYPTGPEPSSQLVITFAAGKVAGITNGRDGTLISLARLDPARIGSFHPIVHEDRLILAREEVPSLLMDTLLAVEDRNFYSHWGLAPLSVLRALFANIRVGKTIQGGSTLTQQLVKNLFLYRERTLGRKVQEAIMALILEYSYDKDEILTTYTNEVYLGQDDNRAVHGFALASQFYFRRELRDLRPDQVAVLVGMVKGPTAYDPRRNPEQCLARRNLVLDIMEARGILTTAEHAQALGQPLTEIAVQKNGFNRFPAFLDLVRQQLAAEYREEDLKANGLRILTTLDPQIQSQVEANLLGGIASLENKQHYRGLEGAVVVTGRENGEILALAGGKKPQMPGFNRALQARRPIGSLVKPAVYLAALQNGLTLASPLDDTAVTSAIAGETWRPENYDHKEHGRVPLYAALANSYNLATVRLGQDVGLDKVLAVIRKLGHTEELQPFPSLLLGAVDMSPLQVTQMYQTITAGGFYTALRAIDSVMAPDHTLLSRYGLAVEERFAPEIMYLLTHALQRVVSEGTGRALLSSPLGGHGIAGKTGTSDNLRDSWFAGFSGDHLAVVWLGRDDNTPIGLSGSTGALRVWEKIMGQIVTSPLVPLEPEGIVWVDIDGTSGSNSTTPLPFLAGSQPAGDSVLAVPLGKAREEAQGVFETIRGWFQ